MRGAADYLHQLQALLPSGAAWPRAPGSMLTRLLAAWAESLARLEVRLLVMLDEADPRVAQELLADWERVAGLPDPCLPAVGAVAERQLAVWRKLAGMRGQTPAFYIELAAALGYQIQLHEFDPAVAAGGFDTSGGRWRFVWRVHVLNSGGSTTRFRAGRSVAGERLVTTPSTSLECLLARLKPAHTHVVFSYPEP